MELKTTLVKFNVAKRQMIRRTDNALMFDLGDDRVWIPHKKMIVKDSDNENFNQVIMPRWVFLKTNLPLYFKAEEFDHIVEVNE